MREIRFGSYNIHNGQNGVLWFLLRGMAQVNLDLVVLKDNNFTYGVYTCESAGYSVVAMGASIQHYGGVAVFYCVTPRFSVKALQQVLPIIVIFHRVTGE